ncbi:hypothetical protein CyaNS01_02835 [Cyanobium sp. NS01]|nr:hypothetical protein CyaNS01_02835 [Cyanobium sp. NS01]
MAPWSQSGSPAAWPRFWGSVTGTSSRNAQNLGCEQRARLRTRECR